MLYEHLLSVLCARVCCVCVFITEVTNSLPGVRDRYTANLDRDFFILFCMATCEMIMPIFSR